MRFLGCVFSVFLFLAWGQPAQAAAPLAACVDGVATVGSGSSAVGYPCLRVDLMSHLSIPELGGTADETTGENNAVSDIWGWVSDPDGTPGNTDDREFAIIGLYCSTAFVEITDPVNPVLVGTLADHTEIPGGACYEAPVAPKRGAQKVHHEEEGATWRDIKVINDYAYIVSDHSGAGMQVFDLSRLLTATVPENFTENNLWEGTFGNAHNVFTYQGVSAPYAVVVGSTSGTNACSGTGSGGPIFYDLSTPTAPAFVGKYCADGYTHDIQCVVYTGPDAAHQGQEICLASNEDTLTIFDASNKTAFIQLARQTYDFATYTHQGWLDAEQEYFYLNDEMDEREHVFPTRTIVWDVRNLDSPAVVEEYLGTLMTVDHNNYVVGDYLYQSNYTSGLRILDISDRVNPYQKAFFDTVPGNNSLNFDGSWSNYAWYSSGVVAVSDISSGLFVVRPVFDDANATDLSVSVTTPLTEYEFSELIDFTLSVKNDGSVPADDTYATLRIPLGSTFIPGTPNNNNCGLIDTTLMRCLLGTLAAGESVNITVQGYSNSSVQLAAIAMVSELQKDSLPANNRDSIILNIVAAPPIEGGGGATGYLLLLGLLGMVVYRLKTKD